jgi:hypothetical protein
MSSDSGEHPDDEFASVLASAARPTTPSSPALTEAIDVVVAAVVSPRPRRGRVPVVAAVLAPLLVLTGAGAAFAASGVDWFRFWNNTPAWSGWATHPDAEVTYRLPGGGTCTLRLGEFTVSPATNAPAGVKSDPAAAGAARAYLHAGTVLADAPIRQVLLQNRSDENWATTSDGRQVRFGYGTDEYNADFEYAGAVHEAIQDAITQHVEEAGYPSTGLTFQSQEQCSGMRQ